jgi:flavodoxin
MKVLIICDSVFGNTEKIAQAMGRSLDDQADVVTLLVNEVKREQLMGLALLIAGSPTRAFRPTPAVTNFLKSITPNGLKGIKVAAFDTRIFVNNKSSWILRFFIKIFGYAAKPIADGLKKKGGELILPPEGFFVQDSEGPLQEGEIERAASWAKTVYKRSIISTH